ncbi:xanthine/uracil permease [Anaeramoeba flamelloides]|uniref:Xanthine/uracil permease n=1 Tax=Anaeramoeba flamelloides TaxID=1746091 RepID=A0AAV7ZNN3_9EUKA|nr:xanthine/uracil permease [Anaeramoeba flamelloides]
MSTSSSSSSDSESKNSDVELGDQNKNKDEKNKKKKKQGGLHREDNHHSPYEGSLAVKLDKFFEISKRGSSFKREIYGGIAMFLASLYILTVHPQVLQMASVPAKGTRMVTALLSGLGTISMGIFTGIPIFISNGMGQNYFYALTICANNSYEWNTASSLVFIQGIIIVAISWGFLRIKFLSSIPPMFRIGIGFGIALFIGTLGISSMFNNPSTSEPELHFRLLLAVLCLVMITALILRNKIYVFILAPIVTSIVSQIIRAAMSDFEMEEWGISGMGETVFKINFKWKVSALWLIPVMSINQLFDAVCTTLTVIQFAFLDKIQFDEKRFMALITTSKTSKLQRVIMLTGLWSSISGAFGNAQMVPFIESIVGGTVGARTGLSSVVTGLCFILSIFIYPLFALIPNEATAPLMVYTTALVIEMITHVDFSDLNTIIPIVISTITMPLMSSILLGIALGYSTLILLWLVGPEKKYKDIKWPMIIVFILSVVGIVFELRD